MQTGVLNIWIQKPRNANSIEGQQIKISQFVTHKLYYSSKFQSSAPVSETKMY